MRRLGAVAAGLLLPLSFIVPAAADEPTPEPEPTPPPAADCSYERAQWAVYEELYLSYRDGLELTSGIAQHWQQVAVDQGIRIKRLEQRKLKLNDRVARLKHRIEELRERLGLIPVDDWRESR
jgi:hypothetical protein